MQEQKRPFSYWIFIVFIAISILLMLIGQTMSVFDYNFTVQMGLQESEAQVGAFGVQVNRAFGTSDTLVYIPLLIASLVGLLKKKRWSLITMAAVAGISVYWATTSAFIFIFGPGTVGYNYEPDFDIWLFVLSYMVFGIWGVIYLLYKGEKLIR